MMKKEMAHWEQITATYLSTRYTKIFFTVEFSDETDLVREKASALRGGMGEMLLRAHCIKDRKCEQCEFETECLLQKTMYSKFENKPDFMTGNDSVGYIVHCSDRKEHYYAGDTMEFSLYLFGKTIVYFSQFLNAFYALGQSGLGRNQSRYQIVSVKNLYGQPILEGSNVYMERYRWQTLADYVEYRKKKLSEKGIENRLVFSTPASIKHGGEFISEFSPEALAVSLTRRLYVLACFEGNEIEKNDLQDAGLSLDSFPAILTQEVQFKSIERYSSRKSEYMKLKGIYGTLQMDTISNLWLPLLLAGEITRIGKNTSFGFGKYFVC